MSVSKSIPKNRRKSAGKSQSAFSLRRSKYRAAIRSLELTAHQEAVAFGTSVSATS